MRATWPTHLILLDLIIWITFGEGYKLQGSLLRSLLQIPTISSLSDTNIMNYV
jgi:hypothetical protein